VSDSEHPETASFRELEKLVRALGEELSTFRRRALQAEGRVRELEASLAGGGVEPSKLAALEAENKLIQGRLDAATGRARQMLDRVRFLRQQQQRGVER
jgi:hypothetical protein